jgi:CheY-like chemotaxis protein
MNINVMIVDDQQEVRYMLRNMFEDWSDQNDHELDIKEFECGADVVDIMTRQEWRPHIASVDFIMQKGDGALVVKELRKHSKNMPIIMITAWAETERFKDISDECLTVSKTDINQIDDTLNDSLDKIVEDGE